MTDKGQKTTKGRPPRHGGYSLLVRAGELPEKRKYLRAYLSAERIGLVRDLGPTEQDLTAAQIILIDRTVTALGIVRCVEEYIRENSVMAGRDLAPALQQSYLAYCSHIRLNLAALGIKTRAGEGVMNLSAYVLEHDKRKSETKARKASPEARRGQAEAGGSGGGITMAGPEIARPGASSEDISGQGESGIDCKAPDDQDRGSGQDEMVHPSGLQSEDEQVAQLQHEIADLEARKKQLEAGRGK